VKKIKESTRGKRRISEERGDTHLDWILFPRGKRKKQIVSIFLSPKKNPE
jgi:hypothetical protein